MKSIRDFKCDDGKEKNAEADLESIRHKYDGMSQDELMLALMQTVSAAKRDGTFTDESLEDFVGFVSPNLDGEQRRRLGELADMIRNS